ncbi:prepilin peptidase [Paenibacillus thermotolerans]|uniref:prepilin peptidase n=1 Tax=Paenibacillus thermotolerans TaxID=3027807 RepID=UPI00236873C8|nr:MULTISPECIES: A24 family peptidase [unclassified Paenibacillus]
MIPTNITDASVILFALAGAITDVSRLRIPNALCAAGAAYGCALQLLTSGWIGVAASVGGMAAGFLLSLTLHMLGAVGAGDVKWFAAAGAIAGSYPISILLVTSVFVSGIAGCFAYVCSEQFRRSVRFLSIELFIAAAVPTLSTFCTLKKVPGFRFPFMLCVLAALTMLHLDVARWIPI